MKISKYMSTKLITASPEMTVKDAFLAIGAILRFRFFA